MQILELAQYLLTLSHWSVVTNTSQVISPPISLQNCTQLPLVLAPLSAEAKSPHGSSDLAAAAAGAGAGAAAAGLFRSRPPRSQRRSRLGEAEAAAPITEDSGDRGSTGEDRGVRLEAPGIWDKLQKYLKLQKNHKTVLLLTTLVVLLLVAEGGGLIPPAGGGGSIPRPPAGRPLAGRALSLLGMFIFTFIV